MHIGFHNVRRISPGKAPHDIASGISDMSANTVGTFVNVINQSFLKNRNELFDSFRQKKTSSAQLSQS